MLWRTESVALSKPPTATAASNLPVTSSSEQRRTMDVGLGGRIDRRHVIAAGDQGRGEIPTARADLQNTSSLGQTITTTLPLSPLQLCDCCCCFDRSQTGKKERDLRGLTPNPGSVQESWRPRDERAR